jgi:NADPH:quinone reductase
MQAIVLERFGPPEVLELHEVPDPVPGPRDVLIEVARSSVTFVETQIRSGRPPHVSMLPSLPAIPGNGVAGTVVAAGAEVDADVRGARVVSQTGGTGGYAQLVSVAADAIIPIPETIGLPDAAALLADGRTALALIEQARVEPGAKVLVEAAAGGVGTLLVQSAKHAGALVVAAAAGERKLELARSLGADVVVDYELHTWTDEVASAVGGNALDVVFDGVGGSIGRDAFKLLRRGGRLCTFGMASGSFASVSEDELRDHDVQRLRGTQPDQAALAALTARALANAVAGTLRPVIGQEFPLAQARDAHRAIEERATIGKTLLTPSTE